MAVTKTTKEFVERIEQKLDKILEDINKLQQAIAINSVEHNKYDTQIKELAERKNIGVQAFAWVSSVLAVMLTIINIIKGV